MLLTAEVSLYPLATDYLPVIKSFIRRLREYEGLTLVTNAMSTQVTGDFERVFAVVGAELRASCETYGKQVLVCKFIPGDLDIAETPDV